MVFNNSAAKQARGEEERPMNSSKKDSTWISWREGRNEEGSTWKRKVVESRMPCRKDSSGADRIL